VQEPCRRSSPHDPRLVGEHLRLQRAQPGPGGVRHDLAQQVTADAAALPLVLDQDAQLGDALVHRTAARERDDGAA
jgi:hypothetical protein